jgi:hypothetical protein
MMRTVTLLTLAVGGLMAFVYTGAPASAGSPSASASLPLAGKVIGIDPGHNGRIQRLAARAFAEAITSYTTGKAS